MHNTKLYKNWLTSSLVLLFAMLVSSCTGSSNGASDSNQANGALLSAQVGSVSSQLYAVGSYGYVGQKSESSLNSLVYPKVDYTSIAYGNKLFVGVGKSGQIIIESEGSTKWSTVPSFTTENFTSVKFIGNNFVAVGDNGYILISTDGKFWNQLAKLPQNYILQSIAGDGLGNYVTVGGNGLVYTIQNSNLVRINSFTSKFLSAVSYANGRFVAVGESGIVFYSNDKGTSWTAAASGSTSKLNNIKFVNGSFYAVGQDGAFLSSTDGSTWSTKILSGFHWSDIDYDASSRQYILLGWQIPDSTYRAKILVSKDLKNWTSYKGVDTSYSYNSVACSSSVCAIVGARGMNLTTTDGETIWSIQKANSTEFALTGVATVSSNVVAVGGGGAILYSPDSGNNWTAISQGWNSYDLNRVNSFNDSYYAVGSKGTLLFSADGKTWSSKLVGSSQTLNDITYSANVNSNISYPWMIVGNAGLILVSKDSNTWFSINSGTSADLYRVIYDSNNGVFVVSGANGLLMTTPALQSGVKFTTLTTGVTQNLRGIAAGLLTYNGVSQAPVNVALGESGVVLLSINNGVYTKVDCGYSGTYSDGFFENGALYVYGQLGMSSLVTLNSAKLPTCSVLNSNTDVSLNGVPYKANIAIPRPSPSPSVKPSPSPIPSPSVKPSPSPSPSPSVKPSPSPSPSPSVKPSPSPSPSPSVKPSPSPSPGLVITGWCKGRAPAGVTKIINDSCSGNSCTNAVINGSCSGESCSGSCITGSCSGNNCSNAVIGGSCSGNNCSGSIITGTCSGNGCPGKK